MTTDKVKVGIVGCGNISGIYFRQMIEVFKNLDVTACADLDIERARARAAEWPGVRACTVEELLRDPEIEIVVNLTTPGAHAEVACAALRAGKHVHGEKPLAVTRREGKRILALAGKRGLRVGSAPDTFLGGGIQTCRRLIDEGVIGEPIGATAFMMCRGHESWHPAPEFYYQPGGGPMFDMGPYYLTALVSLLGPVRRVTGSTRVSFPERTITSAARYGEKIQVEVPTHVAGIMDFAAGAVGAIITSFDVRAANLPRIEIYGSEGSLAVPDPNGFGGPVCLSLPAYKGWIEAKLTHGYAENHRGIGVADLACALRSGRAHRASGELAYHVLDIMEAFHDASSAGRHITLKSTCARPAPLPARLPAGTLDE